jgi:hypothetical protein
MIVNEAVTLIKDNGEVFIEAESYTKYGIGLYAHIDKEAVKKIIKFLDEKK